MPTERLQKILAHAGVSSRRAAELLIQEGHVRVNGRVIKELGSKADPYKDRVELHGKRLVAEHPVYYLLHKPREVVTTLADPEKRESVADLTRRIPERVFPVGRLDYHTSGALLMTNDGEMAQALLHPKKQVPKVYVAKVRGKVSNSHLQQLRLGVSLDDGHKTRPAEVFIVNEDAANMWLQITITEGKNRQVHRMLEAVGHRVQRLFRLSFAGLSADGLRTGEFRVLTDGELAKLKRDYLNPSKKEKAEVQRSARRARNAIAMGVGGAEAQPWKPARSVPRPQREREAIEDGETGGRRGPGGPKRGTTGGRDGAERGARTQRERPAPEKFGRWREREEKKDGARREEIVARSRGGRTSKGPAKGRLGATAEPKAQETAQRGRRGRGSKRVKVKSS